MMRRLLTTSVFGLSLFLFGSSAFAEMRLPLFEDATVSAQFVSEMDRVSYEVPFLGSIEVTTRSQETVTFSDLRERLRGFVSVEEFEEGRVEAAGKACQTWRLRLVPSGEGPWRLMPFVLRLRDSSTGVLREVVTHALTFPAPLPLPVAAGVPECALEPERIGIGWRTMAVWSLWGIGAMGVIFACLPLFRRLRRTLHERTLSPEERARLELERLMGQGLLAQGAYKRFYSELTGVVRRYFERGYAIRASRQTTQEFLARLATDARFGAEIRAVLADFLGAADRVKFAGVAASSEEATAAASLARDTIETDAARRSSEAHV
ncbi:MAG: hypothetical protein RSD41_05940 [Kiritimatiellia bacterium]